MKIKGNINKYGFSQGRLTVPYNGELQCFPQNEWQNEFINAGLLGCSFIELLIERERNHSNPIWSLVGRKEILDSKAIPKTRDLVIPPSDPLIHYFGGILRERFGFGSAYLVFHKEEPIAAFKANTRNSTIDVTDFVGDSELEKEALRVMKEFAWEHQMPLTGDLYEKLRSR